MSDRWVQEGWNSSYDGSPHWAPEVDVKTTGDSEGPGLASSVVADELTTGVAEIAPDVVGLPSRAAVAPWSLGVPPSQQPAGLLVPPDTVLDGGSVDGCEVRLASTRGSSHRYFADPRQDHAAVHVTGGWVLAAVADGVGSEGLSHLGAQFAVESVLQRLSLRVAHAADIGASLARAHRALADVGPHGLFCDVAESMVARARRELSADLDLRTLSTTLCVAAVSPPDQIGRRLVTVWRIGDSAAFALSDGRWHAIFEEGDSADLMSTATEALPEATAGQRNEGVIQPGLSLFLMTDGLALPLGDGAGEVGRYLAGRWQTAPDALAFLLHAQFHRKGFDDDRSVIGIWIE